MMDLGIISTPVLHYVVTCHNDGGEYVSCFVLWDSCPSESN